MPSYRHLTGFWGKQTSQRSSQMHICKFHHWWVSMDWTVSFAIYKMYNDWCIGMLTPTVTLTKLKILAKALLLVISVYNCNAVEMRICKTWKYVNDTWSKKKVLYCGGEGKKGIRRESVMWLCVCVFFYSRCNEKEIHGSRYNPFIGCLACSQKSDQETSCGKSKNKLP